MMNNELLLQTDQPIPFLGARVNIHNPKIKEIGVISEESFQKGIHFLNFSKDMLNSQDKSDLEGTTDFDIFMSIMLSKERADFKNDVLKLLILLFPDYDISFTNEGIKLTLLNDKNNYSFINNSNYDEFRSILTSIFDLDDVDNKNSYNPADARAAKIAEKLAKGKQKVMQQKGESSFEKVAIFSRYISILSVALAKDKNQLVEYTVYQLKDEFKRWQLKDAFDMNIKARLAGATDLDEAENWMDDIHKASK